MSTDVTQYQNWRVDIDDDKIAWWWLDKKDSSANTLNKPVLEELSELIINARADAGIRGVIIASAKKSGFIAGADIQQFTQLKTMNEAYDLIRRGQLIFDDLAALSSIKPTVAMIEGFCLGGGLELSLACRYRVAVDDPKTKIGQPEVLLGICPGWGGSVRLPQLIGAANAMDLILTGRSISASSAAKLGVVDAAVPKRDLFRAAKYYVLQHPEPHHLSALEKVLDYPIVRPIFAKYLRSKVAKHAREDHYPAPYAIITNWERDGATSLDAMENEAKTISELLVGDTAQNLIRVFFLQEKLKGLAKNTEFKAKHVHIIGAGVMGGDIAAWCSFRGLSVTLQDREPKFIAPAIKRAYDLFQQKLKKPRLIQAAMDRLLPDLQGTGLAHADIIIEAISENIEAKQKLFKLLELGAKPDAILATNTSSIALADISSVMQNPSRLIGVHFFNPVAKLPLVEVVYDTKTDQSIINKALAFVGQIGKFPLPVKSAPGFLVNRVLMPYMMEAMLLLKEGVAAETIDQAAVDFGMPMGPIELADTVGLDICLSVAKHLSSPNSDKSAKKEFAELEKLVNSGNLGRKTGKGFYVYNHGKPEKNKPAEEMADIPVQQRLIMRMLNEAMACYREKIVAGSDLVDAGLIFGTGFAPFRGGPLHYAKKQGYTNIVQQLKELEHHYGERFKPDTGWGKES